MVVRDMTNFAVCFNICPSLTFTPKTAKPAMMFVQTNPIYGRSANANMELTLGLSQKIRLTYNYRSEWRRRMK
jgi:hypothetical protein